MQARKSIVGSLCQLALLLARVLFHSALRVQGAYPEPFCAGKQCICMSICIKCVESAESCGIWGKSVFEKAILDLPGARLQPITFQYF